MDASTIYLSDIYAIDWQLAMTEELFRAFRSAILLWN